MRAVLQRVKGATVHVDGKLVSRIGPGIVALIGVEVVDTRDEIPGLAKKVLNMKLWNEGQTASSIITPAQYLENHPEGSTARLNANGHEQGTLPEGRPWKLNVMELGGEILCVSQFTLHARLNKGTKPDFHRSKPGGEAREIYEAFLTRLGEMYDPAKIKDGAFGEMMDVSLTNDGPVTLLLDTQEDAAKKNASGTSTPSTKA